MSDPNWEKMRELIREELKPLQPKAAAPEPPKQPTGSGEDVHRTVAEMLDCPTCSKGAKEAILKTIGLKECKDCHSLEKTDKEYCEHCGEQL